MKRHVYLSMQSRQEAQRIFWSRFEQVRTKVENIGVRQANKRICASPVFARFSAPSFHFAAMDGLAVRAEDSFGASDATPITLDISSGQAILVNTGNPMPDKANAVIMIEHALLDDDHTQAEIHAPVYPWQNVGKVGEDIVASELLFPSEHTFRAADLAALITGGFMMVAVYARPEVVIIPTGAELVALEPGMEEVPPGKTLESNSAALAVLAEEAGARVRITPIVPDDAAQLKQQVQDAYASGADAVVINAGSSAGSADFTAQVIADLGEILVHGVTMMPGKPVILGEVQGRPIIGVPGYPVSSILAMEHFMVPLLAKLQGVQLASTPTVEAVLAKDLPSRAGMEEFRRMIVGKIDATYVAMPLKKGAGAITTLTRANGMLRIDAASEGEKQGSQVHIELLVPKKQIARTILCTGSHDPCLDILNDCLCQGSPAYPLGSTHVGSLGGIFSLKNRMCHLAGAHLLEPTDGTYNIAAIRRYLDGRDIRVITFMHREQGFFVPKGNPLGIGSVQDLVRTRARFVNRQAGSGTRVLFDYELSRQHIDPDDISGYSYDEYTHMAVAVAVLSGKADVGLGVRSAAQALNLDFIPLTEERFDLLIPGEIFDSPMIQAVLNVLSTSYFQQAVTKRGGYSTRATGQEVKVWARNNLLS